MESERPLRDRARDLLARDGLDALVAYSNGTASILKAGYFRYLSGVRPLGRHNAAVLGRDGRSALLVTTPEDRERARELTWIGDVRSATAFANDLDGLLAEWNLTGKVAVAGQDDWTPDLQQAIGKRVSPVPGDALVEELSAVKTDAELTIARKAAWIADVGFHALLAEARVGVSEFELVAEVEHAMRRAGAEDVFMLLGTGAHNKAMHAPTDRRIEPEDTIIAEVSPVHEGLFVQICRTLYLGEPPPQLRRDFALLQRAHREALALVRAGLPAAEVSQAMNRVFGEAGYGEFCRPPYMRTRGHGFGFGSILPGGRIDETTPGNLEHHQIIVVHPNQYLPETGYLACGETLLVTREGWEPLGETRSELCAIPV